MYNFGSSMTCRKFLNCERVFWRTHWLSILKMIISLFPSYFRNLELGVLDNIFYHHSTIKEYYQKQSKLIGIYKAFSNMNPNMVIMTILLLVICHFWFSIQYHIRMYIIYIAGLRHHQKRRWRQSHRCQRRNLSRNHCGGRRQKSGLVKEEGS